MKVAVVDRQFESNMGEMKSTNFQMKSTPHAFKVLSSSLYKNIELAVVRELIANAWDSHAVNGNLDTPFYVHAPTTLEPFFEVRDTGVGMSPDFVHSTYITFFDSDKSHSDDAIGGFGLGSKAPFAYSDQFVMTSRYNGTEYKYQLLINGDSEYQIMDRGNRPTDEPNGVSVRVPVADKDRDKFVQAVLSVLTYFPKGVSSNITVTPPEYSAEIELSDGVVAKFLNRGYGYGYGHTHSVVMGFIRYDVGVHSLNFLSGPNDNSNHRYSHQAPRYFNSCDIYAPIGYFDITPDREGIRFSDLTKANYTKLNYEIQTEVLKQSQAEYAKCITPVQKLKYLFSLSDNQLFENTIDKTEIQNVHNEFAWPDGLTVTELKEYRSSRYGADIKVRGSAQGQPSPTSPFGYPKIYQRAFNQDPPTTPTLYQMDKKRPYLKHFNELREADAFVDPTYVITGDKQAIDKWARDLKLPPIPVVPKIVRTKGIRIKGARKYAATKYSAETHKWAPSGKREVYNNPMTAREALDTADVLFLHRDFNLSCTLDVVDPEALHKKTIIFLTPQTNHTRVAKNLIEDGALSLAGTLEMDRFRIFYTSPAVNTAKMNEWLGRRSAILESEYAGQIHTFNMDWKTLRRLGYHEIIDYANARQELMRHNNRDNVNSYIESILSSNIVDKTSAAFKKGLDEQRNVINTLSNTQTYLVTKYGEWVLNAGEVEAEFKRFSEDYWASRTKGFTEFLTHLLEDRSL